MTNCNARLEHLQLVVRRVEEINDEQQNEADKSQNHQFSAVEPETCLGSQESIVYLYTLFSMCRYVV